MFDEQVFYGMGENLLVLLILVPLVVGTWWWTVRLINKVQNIDLKAVYSIIYSNAYTAVAARLGTMWIVYKLVELAYGRPV